MFQLFKHSVAVCAFAALMSGCATTVDLSKFHDADLKEAEVMPNRQQLAQKRLKVVVFEADEGKNTNAVNAHLGETFAKAVEKELTASGTEIVDRAMAGKLKSELNLAESRGAGNYKGPEVAQYAVRGKLSSAEYINTFHEANSYTDKDGKSHYNPAYYEHVGKVSGSIEVFDLPSLRLVTTFNIEGSASIQDQLTWANWYGGRPTEAGALLLRNATFDALHKESAELKNIFAPKGYVVEQRSDGKKSIFKVMMGRSQGLKAEDKVVIYSLRHKTNALTGKDQIDEIPVLTAKVSDQVGGEESWVVPENNDASAQVKLGDFVKVQYEKPSVFSDLVDKAKKAM